MLNTQRTAMSRQPIKPSNDDLRPPEGWEDVPAHDGSGMGDEAFAADDPDGGYLPDETRIEDVDPADLPPAPMPTPAPSGGSITSRALAARSSTQPSLSLIHI